jgi:hypothetical protein
MFPAVLCLLTVLLELFEALFVSMKFKTIGRMLSRQLLPAKIP